MTWHVTDDLLDSYMSGGLPTSEVWSVEAHVSACEECRSLAGPAPGRSARLETIWDATIDRIDTPRPRVIERLLGTVGVPDHVARLLGATPSLTVPWLLAVAVMLGSALAVAWSSAGDTPLLDTRTALFPFLVLAPLVPVAGVAVAFGPIVDPAYEVAVASPFHGFRLLLIRTVAVLATSMALALGLAVLLPDAGLLAAAWIVPGLALAGFTLAATTFISPLAAGIFSSVLWLIGVTAVEAGPNSSLVAFGWTGQFISLGVLAAAVVVIAVRRDTYEIGSRR